MVLSFIFQNIIRITNVLSSPDGSKYPFGLGFSPKDIADSGSEVDVKPNNSAPKKKTAKCCYNAVLKNRFCLFIRVPIQFDS